MGRWFKGEHMYIFLVFLGHAYCYFKYKPVKLRWRKTGYQSFSRCIRISQGVSWYVYLLSFLHQFYIFVYMVLRRVKVIYWGPRDVKLRPWTVLTVSAFHFLNYGYKNSSDQNFFKEYQSFFFKNLWSRDVWSVKNILTDFLFLLLFFLDIFLPRNRKRGQSFCLFLLQNVLPDEETPLSEY